MNNVTQDQTADFATVACLFTISPVNRSFPAAGGTGTITINSPDPQSPWTARSNATWLTISSATLGQGSATLTFNVAPTNSSRIGALTVAGNTFTVWQEVNPCGAAAFTSAQRFSVGRAAEALAAEDFNNDGRLDLAVGEDNARIEILLSVGQGSFAAPAAYPSFLAARSLIAADFNGDGAQDLVAVGGGLVLLTGVGNGQFSAPVQINGGESPAAMAAADFNADGKLDLAVAGGNRNTALLLGTGAGSFAAPVTLSTMTSPTQITTGDFNGDGRPDLVTVNSSGVSIFINNGAGGFNQSALLTASQPEFIIAADFNKDGRPDVATVNAADNNVSLLLHDVAGGFNAVVNFVVSAQPRAIASGDFNNDGRTDLVVTHQTATINQTITILLGNGAGGFGNPTTITTDRVLTSVTVADLNNDGRADLIGGTYFDDPSLLRQGNLSVLLGNGDGTFGAVRRFAENIAISTILVYDFNGDGQPDIAAPTGSNALAVLFGDGLGWLAAPTLYPLLPPGNAGYGPRDAAWGDFNGDGRPDVVATNWSGRTVEVLIGNGRGEFAPVAGFYAVNPRTLAVGDYNGDGRDDIATASVNTGASYNTVLLNNCVPSTAVTTVSAASFARATTGGAIVAAFGTALATTTQSATTLPLPTELGGVLVTVRDSAGVARQAPLFFVSPQQINYLIPLGTAPGGAVITINNNAGVVATGTAQIERIAPALFSAAASGQGVAAAVVLRVKADGTQTFEPVARYDEMQSRFVAVPIDFGAETDQLFLLLFGTGLRNRSSLSAVTARVGGLPVELLYAGAQGDFVGLDQVNLRLPRNLIGRGEVDIALIVDGGPANTVKVNFK